MTGGASCFKGGDNDMKLFDMDEADLDRFVQSHYDRLYEDYYGLNRPEPCCYYCEYYLGGDCCREEADEPRDYDDYCDHFRAREDY